MRIHTRRRKREFGTEKRKILFGRKISKTKEQTKRKVRRHIRNGKRNLS